MAEKFRASENNPMMRDCPDCGDRSIPILSPDEKCDDCQIDDKFRKLNVKANQKNKGGKFSVSSSKTIRADASKSKQSKDDFDIDVPPFGDYDNTSSQT